MARTKIKLLLTILMTSSVLLGMDVFAVDENGTPEGDDICDVQVNDLGDCIWMSPNDRKDKYAKLMSEAVNRLQATLTDSGNNPSVDENVIRSFIRAQKAWEQYNLEECDLRGALNLGAAKYQNREAVQCETDGIKSRFMKLNRSLICMEKSSLDSRSTDVQECLTPLIVLMPNEEAHVPVRTRDRE